MTSYDVVIVGGGTAGCVLASRLSENPDCSILLLEAGAHQPETATPLGWTALMGSSADWADTTVAQPGLGAATLRVSRGRGLGGGSAINGLSHRRGHRSSYDAWAAGGAAAWGFDDLLPYFRRSETAAGRDHALRGDSGPMLVTPDPAPDSPLGRAFLDAAAECGHELADDVNSGAEIGFGWSDVNVVDGARQSAADAYLRPHLDRPNLTVVTEASAQRLRIEGDRCTGVDYLTDGRVVSVDADSEVVLSAGTFGSAQLLLLSGIGPAPHLSEVGVDVVIDLPGVGENLRDHPLSTVVYRPRRPVPLDPGHPAGEAIGLMRSDPALAAPDLQTLMLYLPFRTPTIPVPDECYAIGFTAATPVSVGRLRLADANPATRPLADPNYLGEEADVEVMIAGLRLVREIGNAAALAEWNAGEVLPGPEADLDDHDAVRACLQRNLLSYAHIAGTCRLGIDDLAVVDTELRVRGVDGLRVADASVMPSLPSGNPNATVLAIAERAAELVAGR